MVSEFESCKGSLSLLESKVNDSPPTKSQRLLISIFLNEESKALENYSISNTNKKQSMHQTEKQNKNTRIASKNFDYNHKKF